MPIPNVADEAFFKEWDDRLVRATTTVASLDAAQTSGDRPRCQEAMGGVIAQTRSERASKHSYDSPLLGGNTPRSDEERMDRIELDDGLMNSHVPPTTYYSPLSETAAGELVIRKLKKKVKKLEKKLRARTPRMKLFKIGTSRRKSLDKENVSKQGRKSDKTKPMFDDSDFAELDVDNAMENVEGNAETQGRNTAEQITTVGDTVNTASIDVSAARPSNVSTANTLVAIRSTRPRTTSVIIHDVEEELRRSTPAPTTQPSSKDKGKALMVEPEKPTKNPRKGSDSDG
ncbi:hypothetical protein Tco_1138306 [Tanacetum coccineum]